jgi:MoaA/NifB/PqqE/SkfB family radical SAM enzyme
MFIENGLKHDSVNFNISKESYILDSKVVVPQLGIHTSNSCNLKCTSCTNFSNYSSGNFLTPEKFEGMLQNWSNKIFPRKFKISGGEPFLNKHLEKIVELARNYFDKHGDFKTYIIIDSNGLLIEKSGFNFDCLKEYDVELRLSKHSNDNLYLEKFNSVQDFLRSKEVLFRITPSVDMWSETYKVMDGTIVPFDDKNIKQSWSICFQKFCKQLYENKIYKCPPVTYYNLTKLKLHDDFKIYDQYAPLQHTACLEDILKFFNSKEEAACSLCPARNLPIKKTID